MSPVVARLASAALLVATMHLPGLALANGPEVGLDGGSIFPIASKDVQLVREYVLARLPLGGGAAAVECEYTLRNRSATAQTFRMGFVTSAPDGFEPEVRTAQYRSADLHVREGRRELPVALMPVDPSRWKALISSVPDSLFTWSVSIAGRDSVRLSIRYHAQWSGGSDGLSSDLRFTYHARPAALWAGPIEKATVVFMLGDLESQLLRHSASSPGGPSVSLTPSGFAWYSSGVKWEFSDWEPADDFSLTIEWQPNEDRP